jgi:serine/threonine protein kinase/Leucine-rich repeat (LRR) protein
VIHFACACGNSLEAPDESAGKKLKCPSCGNEAVVPADSGRTVCQTVPPGKEAVVPATVPAGPIDQETAALSRLVSPEASGERPKDTATCDLNATIDQPGRPAREGSPQDSPFSTHHAPRPTDGPSLGGYRILSELGHGGMGMVYEAEDIKLERRVALKVMKPEIAKDPQHRERFLREASTAASVESVFICPIYEVGEDNDVPFIAMPFLKGEPLSAHWKKSQRLPIEEVLRIGKEVAEGLSAAHEVGLVHRDIKPSNIWLETQPSGPPRAVILDFGLARVQADNAQITRSGVIVGTPAYMSPEQARGDKKVDARTDLFSLGCVLYALCTGELPFKGKQMMDVLVALATQDPRPPHTITATVPQPLSELILRLLAKKPDDRPRAARTVIEELTSMERDVATTRIKPAGTSRLPGRTLDVPQVTPGRRDLPARKSSYARYMLIGVGLLVCVIAVVAGGAYYVATDEGTIEIRSEKPNVRVGLLKDGQEIDVLHAGSGKTWSYPTGTYALRLKGDPAGMEIVPDTFELKRGARHVATIRKIAGSPFADDEVKRIAVLPADQQVDEVRKELTRRNLGFNGIRPDIVDGVVTGVSIEDKALCDISPLRAFVGLKTFKCSDSPLSDLSPLKDMSLTEIWCFGTEVFDLSQIKDMKLTSLRVGRSRVRDLSPLKGMKSLTFFDCVETAVSDLSPLQGIPLTGLTCRGSQVSDLSPLRGMPLKSLEIDDTLVTDVTPLQDLPLEDIRLTPNNISKGLNVLRSMKSLKTIGMHYAAEKAWPAAEFWERCDTEEFTKVAERKAAEYVLSHGGAVCVNGQDRGIGKVADLPPEAFRLTEVHCSNVGGNHVTLTDAGLAAFKDCKNLRHLRLYGCVQITDAGLAHFKNCKNLSVLELEGVRLTDASLPLFGSYKDLASLGLNNTGVTDAGLIHLKDSKTLTAIGLLNTAVGDAGLAHLKDCTNLTSLDLRGTKVTDEGLANFKDCKDLSTIWLHGTSTITGAGLAHLKDCKKLSELWLTSTSVTDEGLAHLKDHKELTNLQLGHTRVTDAGLVYLEDCKKLTVIDLVNRPVTDAGLAHLKACKELKHLNLQNTKMTDAGLAYFKDCKNLSSVFLSGTSITDAGLAHLNDCKNLARLDVQGTAITDAGLAHLVGLNSLAELNLTKTQVTANGVEDLKKALPRCKITWDGGVIAPK